MKELYHAFSASSYLVGTPLGSYFYVEGDYYALKSCGLFNWVIKRPFNIYLLLPYIEAF